MRRSAMISSRACRRGGDNFPEALIRSGVLRKTHGRSHRSKGMVRYWLLPLLLSLGCMLSCSTAYAKTMTFAVVYPEVREPYLTVFLDIIRGMEEELGQPVTHYRLGDRQDATGDLIARMKNDRIDVVITLGQAGYEAAKSLASVLPVVVGAVLLPPGHDSQGLSGISMIPDPEILFVRLRDLVPNAKEVTVIYDPDRKTGEIALARDAAQARGLTLHALQARDLRRSAVLYHKVLQEIEDGSVAIWLLQYNATMDEQALLPLVLREAWNKRFVVFSSSLDHVRKGALFSLYPDNVGLGRSLAAMARSRSRGMVSRSATIEPLRDLLIAVNLRTAEHLGLNFPNSVIRKFGMIFPPRP